MAGIIVIYRLTLWGRGINTFFKNFIIIFSIFIMPEKTKTGLPYFKKGSKEAKEHMAKLRAKKGAGSSEKDKKVKK